MRGNVHRGYRNHKQKKAKRLYKQGPKSILMEVDTFDQYSGEKIGSRFVRVRKDEAIQTRDRLQADLDDINQLITDIETLEAAE